jgi:class 3 adenylate cyclase/CHASE2 domain-containing sensor protein
VTRSGELIALAAAVLAGALFSQSPIGVISGLSYDLLTDLRAETSAERPTLDKIALVVIDDSTLTDKAFRDVPRVLWSPQLADLLDKLKEAKARQVGLDLIFPTTVESQLPNYDRHFRQALRAAATAHAIVIGARAASGSEPAALPQAGQIAAVGASNVRGLNIFVESDGAVRKAPVAIGNELAFAPELVGRISPNRPNASKIDIDWNGIPNKLAVYDLNSVLHCAAGSRELAQALAGRVVLVGTILDGEDRFETPLHLTSNAVSIRPICGSPARSKQFPAGELPGVTIQAAIVATVLDGNPVKVLPWLGAFLSLTLLGWVGIRIGISPRRFGRFGIAALFAAWSGLACLLCTTTGVMIPWLDGAMVSALAWTGASTWRIGIVEREARRIREAFERYLSPVVVAKLLAAGKAPAVGGERRNMTILYIDLENYTAFAEGHEPEEVAATLNRFYAVVVEETERFGGFVAQFAGDASVSFFGAPADDTAHIHSAVRAASAIVARMRVLWSNPGSELPLRLRCGIDTGELLLGNVGTPTRLNYAAVGTTINHAERLQEAAKKLEELIVASEGIARECSELGWVDRGLVQLKGVKQPAHVFALRP